MILKKTLPAVIFLLAAVVFAASYKPTVTVSKCTGCTECTAVCPVKAITMYEDKAVIDPALCTGCSACTRVCSWGAVK